jgi:dTDP-4-dehydrorhamnose reductase
MTRILVTGAAGAVGSYVPAVYAHHELVLTDVAGGHEQLDITDAAAVRAAVGRVRPEVVVHLAAATDVDRCEEEPDLAYRVNALGTENVVRACAETGATLVFISTAGVFSGAKPQYTEFDEPGPVNVYGRSKLAAERAVARLSAHYIVRAGWMIGGGPALDKKFVGKIVELLGRGERRLRAVSDKLGSPTYAPEMLAGIEKLLETGLYGLYHMVNTGPPASRFDIACEIRDAVDPSVEVEPVSSDVFPLPAPRAPSEAMRNYRLELLGHTWMRPWQEALRAYLEDELLPSLGQVSGEARASR